MVMRDETGLLAGSAGAGIPRFLDCACIFVYIRKRDRCVAPSALACRNLPQDPPHGVVSARDLATCFPPEAGSRQKSPTALPSPVHSASAQPRPGINQLKAMLSIYCSYRQRNRCRPRLSSSFFCCRAGAPLLGASGGSGEVRRGGCRGEQGRSAGTSSRDSGPESGLAHRMT